MKMVSYLVLAIFLIVGIIYLVGMSMPNEHVSKRSITIDAPIEKVWDTVIDIENQTIWRSDLKKVEVIERTENGLVWTEYPNKGRPITFREKGKEPYSRYEIEIVPGEPFSGYWVGKFTEVDGGTNVEFMEVGKIHNPIFRVLVYFFFDLEETIKVYQNSLKNHLENNA